MRPTRQAAYTLFVAALADYVTSDLDDPSDSGEFDVDVVGDHQDAYLAACIAKVGLQRFANGDKEALKDLHGLLIGDLLCAGMDLFKAAFDTLKAQGDLVAQAIGDPNAHYDSRAELFATLTDGARNLLEERERVQRDSTGADDSGPAT